MKQRLLQQLSFAKPLRLVLVLSTLLLTQTAWGQTNYQSGTLNTTNNTWGDWTLSSGPTYQVNQTNNLGFSGASTITLTLSQPANTTDLIREISLEIGGGISTTTLQSAKIGTTDITTSFQLDNTGIYTYTPAVPAGWSGDIVITLKGTNDAGSILSAYVYTVTNYGVTVAGIPVTSTNAANGITGSGITGTVTYDATNRILTMTNATINYTSGDAITFSNANTLNVNTVGINSISCGNQKAFNTSGNLNFQTSDASPGQLAITSTSNITPQNYYTCAGPVTYENGLIATNPTSHSVLISINYGINVGGSEVTSANATNVLNNNTVSYDATHNILTLDGASISGAISTELDNLTIKLKGTNTITTTNTPGVNGIISNKNTGTLTFTKEGASASLTITSDVSVIRGFASLNLENSGLYTNTSTPYKIKSDSSYPRLADATTSDTDTTAIKEITISDVATYQLWVSGVQVTEGTNITGAGISGTVTFSASNSTLSLDQASISGILLNNLDELKIEFTRANSITNNYYITSFNTNAALTMSGTGANSTFAINTGTSSTCAVSGFASVTLSDGTYLQTGDACRYKPENKAYIKNSSNSYSDNLTFTTTPYYPLWVYDTQVSSNYNNVALTSGTASYDATNHILTFENAVISSSNAIESELSDFLVIALKGNNRLEINTGSNSPIMSGYDTATLTIKKADINDVNDCQLELGFYGTSNPPVIKGFKSVDYTGLNFVSKTATAPDASTATDAIFSSATIYPLWIEGTIVTEANKNAILGAGNTTVTYDGDTNNGGTNTLTLNNYSYTGNAADGHAIETNITGLKVKLVGANTINCTANSNYAFYTSQSASIQFVKDDANSKLTLKTTPTNPFGGFASGAITYDGLVYYPTGKYIAIPTAPTMAEDNNKVKLDRDAYEGGTIAIKYSIAYADGKTADVTDATYSAPFAIAAPGTVTAWVEANGTNSDETKGKYFGYKDAPFTMKAGDTKTPDLIPAFETGDNIGYKATDAYESSATGVATFTSGTITAVAIGTATVTANLDYSSNTTPVVILNPNKKVTAVVNVGVTPNITFQNGMTYATFCNTGNKDLKVPENRGLTAYAITGVNGTVVTLTQVEFLPKVNGTTYMPLLLKREDNTKTEFGLFLEYDGTASAPTSNLLRYAISEVQTTGKELFVLYKDEFVKATGSIPANKCYLDLNGVVAPARSLGIDSDGTTNIYEIDIENEESREEWYDLQGRRIQQPTKAGLYIKNGKKVIVNTK